MIRVKYKRLVPEAYVPMRAHLGDAGFDLAPVKVEVEDRLVKCSFGLAVEIPPGHVGLVFPRSSIYKTEWRLSNSVGVIDPNYRGELKAFFDIITEDKDKLMFDTETHAWDDAVREAGYKPGERCCQLIIMEIPQVAFVESISLSDSDRGTGGFGSTGNNMEAMAEEPFGIPCLKNEQETLKVRRQV